MKKIYFFLLTLLLSFQLHAQFNEEEKTFPSFSDRSFVQEKDSYSSQSISGNERSSSSSFWSWFLCYICKKLKHSGNCHSTPPPPPPPTNVPIDGGLSILLVAGAAYGARRIRSKKKV